MCKNPALGPRLGVTAHGGEGGSYLARLGQRVPAPDEQKERPGQLLVHDLPLQERPEHPSLTASILVWRTTEGEKNMIYLTTAAHSCMYVCMSVCMYACIYVHTHTHTYVRTYIHTYVHVCTFVIII